MERELVSEQVDALRIEALEARRLAETLGDLQSIVDLENYAAQLEAEAERLGSLKRGKIDDIALSRVTKQRSVPTP
jgi:CHAD domain-containing protein